MANGPMSAVLQHLRNGMLLRDRAALTDGQLLECFLNNREEAAVEALVRRHGPMVWGVCRRILPNHHDAEDAFQATFLVLVRKAASIVPRERMANWLYGVAHRTALKARATAARRKERERQVDPMPEPAVTEQDLQRDLQPLLDQELSRLPSKYRLPIVLCDLEGKTRKEVARQLDWPEGTVAGRLVRARMMLAKRLARHRLVVTSGLLGVLLTRTAAATAGVPPAVVSSTIKTATLVAAGQALTAGTVTAGVAALTKGVLQTLFLAKLQNTILVLLVLAVIGTGAIVFGAHAVRDVPVEPKQQEQKKPVAQERKTPAPPEQKRPVVQAPDAPKDDQASIQGIWVTVSAEKDGAKLDQASEWVINATKIVHKANDESVLGEWTYSLIPTKRPKYIYLTIHPPVKNGVHFGIYELDGDTLKLCYDSAFMKRPAAFATKPTDSGCLLFVLKRESRNQGEKDKP